MNGEQGLVIGVGSRWRPVEAACDHGFGVDHGEIVMDILEMALSASVPRDAYVSQATL